MSIEEECFLSPSISEWIAHHRSESVEWFKLAHRRNQLQQCWIKDLKVSDEDERAVMVALLYVRGLSNFQAAIILAERGLTGEARIIARSCFETAFYLGALVDDPSFAVMLKSDEAARKKKLAKSLLRQSDILTDPDIARTLQAYLDDLAASGDESKQLDIYSAACAAAMKDIYEVYYRDLSNDGVHPSLSSLRRYIAVRENGHVEGFRHGPDATDVRNAIMTACVAVIYVAQFGQHFFEWEDRDDAFKECWETYKQLIEVERSRIGGSQS